MKDIFKLSTAVTGLLLLGSVFQTEAKAITLTQSQSQISSGQSLVYNFNGLAPSDGSDGFLTIASGVGSTFDLSNNSSEGQEYFDLRLDGLSAGRFSCAAGNGVTNIIGCGGSSSFNTFSQKIAFSSFLPSVNLPSLIADGALSLVVDFGGNVNPGFSGPNSNELLVTLDYNTDATPVPTPAPLLGLIGMGAAALRRRQQEVTTEGKAV